MQSVESMSTTPLSLRFQIAPALLSRLTQGVRELASLGISLLLAVFDIAHVSNLQFGHLYARFLDRRLELGEWLSAVNHVTGLDQDFLEHRDHRARHIDVHLRFDKAVEFRRTGRCRGQRQDREQQ